MSCLSADRAFRGYAIGEFSVTSDEIEKFEKSHNESESEKKISQKEQVSSIIYTDSQKLQKLKKILMTRHYSKRTIENYLFWAKKFLRVHKYFKAESQNQINGFLTNLAVNEYVSASTQNQALAALLFYFRFVKHEDAENLSEVIHAKHKKRVPVVLSKEEIKSIIDRLEGSKRLAAELLYGTGMILNELLCLKILDIDFDRVEITIRYGKGGKDRRRRPPSH